MGLSNKTKILFLVILFFVLAFLIYDVIILARTEDGAASDNVMTHDASQEEYHVEVPGSGAHGQGAALGTSADEPLDIETGHVQQQPQQTQTQTQQQQGAAVTEDPIALPPPPLHATPTYSPPPQPISSLSPSQYHPVYKKYDFHEVHPSDIIVSIVTENRPKYLRICLESLSQTLYFNKDNVIVFQYGDHAEVNQIIEEYGFKQVKNKRAAHISDGAEHIAFHYKFIMHETFKMHPDIKSFLIVEDDMIFAPDFLIYFAEMAPILHRDPTVYAVSAYNDNGFRGMVSRDNMVYRTDFFVGLGWLVSRDHWEKEWSRTWPRTHWDHFLRDPRNRRGRHTLFPEVSRIYHIGYKGTHSTIALYEQYFRDIVLNPHGYAPLGMDAEAFEQGKYVRDVHPRTKLRTLDYISPVANYDRYMESLFESPDSVYLTPENAISSFNSENNKILIFFYEAVSETQNGNWYQTSLYFDIWHTIPVRGAYEGALVFEWNTNTVLAVASYSKFSKKYSKGVYLTPSTFSAPPDWEKPRIPTILDIVTSRKGQSCTHLCQERGAECDRNKLLSLNTCTHLRAHFPCKACIQNTGGDQPAYEPDSGRCFKTGGSGATSPQCAASHPKTQRLCACFDPLKVSIYHDEWRAMIQEAQHQATHPYLEEDVRPEDWA